MSQHEEETSFIKTPQLLLTVVVLAFVVPIFGVLLLVKFVVEKPHADTGALTPEAVAARIQPVGRIDFGEAAAGAAAKGPRSGEEIVKAVCAACHATGAAGAPKTGDRAAWAKLVKEPLDKLVKDAITGVKAMPPRGGAPDLSDLELTRAIVFMAAWAPRIKTGTDAMVKSVLGGKGAMPPKGGNATLSEAEIRGVVEFMVSQSK